MTTDARDARSLPEEGFHEIQLSGKQLVFLFMATTVVSVVIFLCGVLVGRGARAEASDGTRAAPVADVSSLGDATAGVPAAEAEPTAAPELAVPEGSPEVAAAAEAAPGPVAGGYYDQLMRDQPAVDSVKPVEEVAEPASPPPAAPPAPEPAPVASPAGQGNFVVQVAALRQRKEAEAVADRLVNRGYQAFVAEPQPGATPFYRVRVGPFVHRAEAEQIVKRLTQEEQFKPWITR
jgi:DedD protein